MQSGGAGGVLPRAKWGWAVYARSTTIHAQLASLDVGIAHVRDEVLPALQQPDGFVGMSMMVDRESGLTITTSSWLNEEAMRASADQVVSIRNRAAEVLGGSPEVDEWEIAVMFRDHPTHGEACVRSAWLQLDSPGIDGLIEVYKQDALPQIERLEDFCSASLMVNRASGRAVSSACFENRAALEASRDSNSRIRSSGTQKAKATVLQVRG